MTTSPAEINSRLSVQKSETGVASQRPEPHRKGPTHMHEPYLLTTAEAGRLMSIGRSGIYALMKRGELASVKVGGSRRIPMRAIEEFINNQLEQGA